MAEEAGKRLLSEEKVLEAVRQLLPELEHPQEAINIRLIDPDKDSPPDEDSTFTVTRFRARTFACRRGS